MPGAGTRQNKFLKIKKNYRVPRAGTRQNEFLKIKKKLPSASRWALGKIWRQVAAVTGRPPFAEWDLCRVPRHSAKPSFAESQALPSAWHSAKPPLPSVLFCRVRHSAKYCFAECPDKKHSAKSQTLGKVQFSCSVWYLFSPKKQLDFFDHKIISFFHSEYPLII